MDDERNQLQLINAAINSLDESLSQEEFVSALEQVERLQLAANALRENIVELLGVEKLFRITRILLVEDDEMQRCAMAAELRDHGFLVAEAADGTEAIRYILEMPEPDVVITDLNMPNCDGNEFIQACQALPSGKSALRVVVTGAQAKDCPSVGIDLLAQKPVDMVKFVSDLKSLVRRRNLIGTGLPSDN